jgi:copper chaperone CopZ
MEKVIKINGMKCEHCQAKAEQALNAINGVEAKVDLTNKQAIVNMSHEVEEHTFHEALSQVGFEVVAITE